MSIRRIFVEKKEHCRIEAKNLLKDLRDNLQMSVLEDVRILNRYDVEGISDELYDKACNTIFSEPPVDNTFHEIINLTEDEVAFAVEYLPGQYDQRADSAMQCVMLLDATSEPVIKSSKVIILKGKLIVEDISKIKKYVINPVDSREALMDKPTTLIDSFHIPNEVDSLVGFIDMDSYSLEQLRSELGLAMSIEDILHTQVYFKDEEHRDPTITEIRVLDTYWSDHCRHTTFLTKIEDIDIEDGIYNKPVAEAFVRYLDARRELYPYEHRDITLMDIALMGMKQLRKEGKLDDLEVSDEINACSIKVKVDVDGKDEDWLVMFKNETHNHPTEIEPFGGAATCLGGAIRDPLSGRSYVYGAMRITGSGDPREKIEDTIEGKLPQRKIAKESAHGYSSYGNQIGLATGKVAEIYHEGYKAKHMELGAVIAAAPAENVIRGKAEPGDIIILLGGRTGRDGCGGATGSSKEHTVESIHTCGAEVQKGNPPTERKIQRLFRKKKVSSLIKKCNDFGAGGVSVAIGELADGLDINLDYVPKKYAGLDGTELSISESQERMAVVVEKNDVETFLAYTAEENIEAVVVAEVTDTNRLVMKWNGKNIVDISRTFLDTNGALQSTDIKVLNPESKDYFTEAIENRKNGITSLKELWINTLKDINVSSKKGLVEMFDSSIGSSTVLMPFGGKYQLTEEQSMAFKIPLEKGDTTTGTLMSYGFNPDLASWSPFHGAYYAVIESVANIVANGGNWRKIRFTFQEYFERLNKEKERWGKPFSSLLGAYLAQQHLQLPSIGGKDSMSGTFHDINVPPTLVSFAVNVVDVNNVISSDLKGAGHKIVYIPAQYNQHGLPEVDYLQTVMDTIQKAITSKQILSTRSIGYGGIVEAVSKMSFGNKVGIQLDQIDTDTLVKPEYGAFILEIEDDISLENLLDGIEYRVIGSTSEEKVIRVGDMSLDLDEAINAYTGVFEGVYATKANEVSEVINNNTYITKDIYVAKNKVVKPKVFIPVFPGTNCEYDTMKQFENAGAEVETFVFKNMTANDIEQSINMVQSKIRESQIIALAGGFSAGDEPDGSGKFITAVFRNPHIMEATMDLLNNRDGLMIGICNGFQALIKLGLVPYGEIRDLREDAPTLTYNTIGRHVSCLVDTKVVSNKSPWLQNVTVGDIHSIPVSHGEGRFVADDKIIKDLFNNGQVAFQYVDRHGNPTYDSAYNPNGSYHAIEGILSPDGRVLGKMGHSERIGTNVGKNIYGSKDQKLFRSGVEYYL